MAEWLAALETASTFTPPTDTLYKIGYKLIDRETARMIK